MGKQPFLNLFAHPLLMYYAQSISCVCLLVNSISNDAKTCWTSGGVCGEGDGLHGGWPALQQRLQRQGESLQRRWSRTVQPDGGAQDF